MSLLYSLMIDDYVSGNAPRALVRKTIDEWLRGDGENMEMHEFNSEQDRAKAQAERDRAEIEEMRKTWGRLPEHQEGLKAAIGMIPGVG